MIRQYLILFLFFLFLGGCAHQIDTKTTLYDDWKPRLSAQKTWQVEGKLAFISPEERQSANLNWQQTAKTNNLILTTFIGTRILSLKQTVNGAELEFDGDEYFDTNASALLKRLTGFTLPVDNADNWLKGTIEDQSLVVDELGRAKQVLWFDKTGKKWQIDYGTYIQSNGYWLPTKLTLKHQQIKIKIQLYDWQFN
ncbi:MULTISPECIES: lipoprotein insertase outer membrane protein LolB [Pseudoalteromonas]|uniref:lipoprotein insertase outer membrane protein LolB n=1 Tax=Pseudoalteromonas TaxID=53246 RepID=UPI0026E2163D|nr:lipoprotein insertase outer membrane protein LolB [Pseudoalteromonas carrageenovora]MDO6464156.1 lipoprotein insertase outer membrane protein LolB [Pseudoalteromonas carrageenovora]